MAEIRARRRLAAILAADVAGFTRLMEADDAGTMAALKARRQSVLEPLVARHHGRVFKVTGDGALVEFASAVDAVQCAIELQAGMSAVNDQSPEKPGIVLRIGVDLGDVMVEGGDLYGDGVNIAARLESIAEPGTILVSGTAHEHVRNKVKAVFDDLGMRNLKNLAQPIRVYRVGVATRRGVPTGSGIADRPSIAVLPFANMSGDPTQDYFSDGITEDIITELSRFRSLFVIARNSSFQYRNRAVDVKQVGQQLGVQYLVEGSIRRSGDKVRVTTQLIEAETGKHIWAERYDRDAHDIFELQDELAHAVAATVGGRIDKVGRDRVQRLSPNGLRAYELHLRAKASYLKFTKQDCADARELELEAMRLEPLNAVYMAYYANCCHIEFFLDWTTDLEGSLNKAVDVAKRAVALDDSDSTVRWILSSALVSKREIAEARMHAEKAIELNPNDSEARWMYGNILTYAGEAVKALDQLALATRLNPFDCSWTPWVRGIALYLARRYGEAIETFSAITEQHQEVGLYVVASHAQSGQLDKARARLQEVLRHARVTMEHFPGADPREWMAYVRRANPYQNPSDLDHFVEGLRKAGLPI